MEVGDLVSVHSNPYRYPVFDGIGQITKLEPYLDSVYVRMLTGARKGAVGLFCREDVIVLSAAKKQMLLDLFR